MFLLESEKGVMISNHRGQTLMFRIPGGPSSECCWAKLVKWKYPDSRSVFLYFVVRKLETAEVLSLVYLFPWYFTMRKRQLNPLYTFSFSSEMLLPSLSASSSVVFFAVLRLPRGTWNIVSRLDLVFLSHRAGRKYSRWKIHPFIHFRFQTPPRFFFLSVGSRIKILIYFPRSAQ